MNLSSLRALPVRYVKDLRNAYTSLNANEIQASAGKPLKVGLLAMSEESLRRMQDFLSPAMLNEAARERALASLGRANGHPLDFDIVLCEPGLPLPKNGFHFESAQPGSPATQIVEANPDLELALARTFPVFRAAVSQKIVFRTARENALFSLMTGLPNIVPSKIELPWALGEFATDTAFLTMNQVRMALTLAAAHDRAVGYSDQKAEIVAIVAGAFGWRALARELIGKIPLGGGLIPKAAVAFAGTYVVGMGLEKLNRTGAGLSRSERRDAWAAAFVKGKDVVAELLPGTQISATDKVASALNNGVE